MPANMAEQAVRACLQKWLQFKLTLTRYAVMHSPNQQYNANTVAIRLAVLVCSVPDLQWRPVALRVHTHV